MGSWAGGRGQGPGQPREEGLPDLGHGAVEEARRAQQTRRVRLKDAGDALGAQVESVVELPGIGGALGGE